MMHGFAAFFSGRCSAPKRSASRRLDCKKTAAVRGFRRWFDAVFVARSYFQSL